LPPVGNQVAIKKYCIVSQYLESVFEKGRYVPDILYAFKFHFLTFFVEICVPAHRR